MAVSQWENGRAVPRMGAVQAIADYFGLKNGDIVNEASKNDVDGGLPAYSQAPASVPLLTLGKVHAGSLEDEETAAHRVDVPATVLASHPRAFALEVEGTCMNRVIPEGAHVLVDPDLEPVSGSIAVIETEDYQALMRRWYKGSSRLMLVADSFDEYEDIVLAEDDAPIRVRGTVVWYQSAEEME